jgi:deoxycytidylate deaminase
VIDREFQKLAKVLNTSGCAKRQVVAGIHAGGRFLTAANFCEFAGESCPRIGIASGTGYELCQAKHAEANLALLIAQEGLTLDSVVCWVLGHYYACEPCAKALHKIGIMEIRVREKL